MKSVISLFLAVSVLANSVLVQAIECGRLVKGERYVHLPADGVVYGEYICRSSRNRVMADPSTMARQTCPGCGKPFDGHEGVGKPPFDKEDGQIYVPPRYIVSERNDLAIFLSGEQWMCGHCDTRNWAHLKTCVSCSAPIAERKAEFDPKAEDAKADPQVRAAREREEADRQAPRRSEGAPGNLTRRESGNRVATIAGKFQDSVVRISEVARGHRRIVLGASIGAGLLGAGVASYFLRKNSYEPVIGEVIETEAEVIIFPDRETYQKYAGQAINLATPPPGVQVFRGDQVAKAIPLAANDDPSHVDGYIVKKFYVTIAIEGQRERLTVGLDSEKEFGSWKKGDKVELELQGPFDHTLRHQ